VFGPSRLTVLSLSLVSLSLLSVGCATKAPPAAAGAPRHPDFLFPAVPEGVAAGQSTRIDRGWQYLQLDDLRNAEREFGAALRQDAAFHPAETAMAYVALARGNEKDAVTRFDRALQAESGYVPALVGRGQALLELDRPGEALASFEAALARDPSLIQLRTRVEVLRVRAAQEMLARAKSAADARRWDEARAAYEQAIAASPESAFLYRELGAVEQQSGRSAEALERYRRAAQLDPSDARSLAAVGGILEAQGDDMGALSAYERARAIDASEVPESVLARVRERVRVAKLPEEYQAIPGEQALTRAQLAALIGVRLDALIARTKPRQVIITDVRTNWAQQWITPVVRSGIMETLPNYEFEPSRRLRRGELATVAARVLGLIGTMKPELAKKWQGARVAIADVPSTHLSYPAVSMAVAAGVLPLAGGTFDLLRPVSGAEALEVVGRLEALAR
jgi:tetratricopeptide (TPR) repeat protein